MARYQWRIKFWPSLIMAIILALFCQLSSWQWHRYHQKLELQRQYHAQAAAPEMALTDALAKLHPGSSEAVFVAVHAHGAYDSRYQIVLDNRSRNGQPGYEIFTPLLLNTQPQQAILIDRGFIPIGHHWQSLPDLSAPVNELTLSGFLTKPQHNFILGQAIEANNATWPLRAARIDITALQSRYPYPLLPYVILLKPQQAGGYLCQWSYPQLFAERSLGYTFQWLALAIATLILWVVISLKRIKAHA